MKHHYGQTTLFGILIACCILFLVGGLMAATMIKIYNKAEECKDNYKQWQYQQESQLTQDEYDAIDKAIADIIERGNNYED